MSPFVSKLATILLAPVILSASCFSCLIQATPVYAAAPVSVEMKMEMDAVHYSDRSVHANHGTDCRDENSHTNFKTKSFSLSDEFHFAMVGSAFDFDKNVLRHQPLVEPLRIFRKHKEFLTGTTIKKE